MVNSNPETVSTDYDTSDKLYFEPLTLEKVLSICDREKPDGVIVQFGGQTPLKLAKDLEEQGVTIIGTSPESIDIAEDRKRFGQLIERLGIQQPLNGTATNLEGALAIAERIGYLNTESFIRAFKKRMHCTPTEHRKKKRAEKQYLNVVSDEALIHSNPS